MKTLQVGDATPSFETVDHLGNSVTQADFAGKRVVLFFYPKANTPGCTAEACDLRDHYAALQQAGYSLYGVSADSVAKQKNFADKFEFPFPLLADESKALIDGFGVWGPKQFMGKEYDGIHRVTFIIAADGTIERVIDKVKTKTHAAQILEEE